MEESDFDTNDLSKSLTERVKELECLYTISRIATKHKTNLKKALELIVNQIPNGWQFPELTQAFLKYGENEVGIPPREKDAFQSVVLKINKEMRGELFVYFKEGQQSNNPEVFLKEEQSLLNQIGYEISSLIELDNKTKHEKIIQEKLRFSDRLNVLGELTAGIAHELNTPLGNIIGYSELINKKESDPVKKNDLERILKSAVHAREIVKKLMFFSCEMPTQFKKSNLNKLIVESLDLLKIQLNDKYIKVDSDLSENLPPLVFDSFQMTQVIFNIVLNAIDAMDPFGVIEVSTESNEKEIQLSISDNGKGIPEDEISRLFQPFYTNKGHNGTGLGLAVTYGIIQAHKGHIEVQSTVGEGTTFTLTFPLHHE